MQYQFSWHGSLAAAINTSALTDDSVYLLTATIGETNISFKMNKITIVNNALVFGSDINSSVVAKGTDTLIGDFGILAGAYSSGNVAAGSKHKVFYMRFEDVNSDCIASFNFSEGAGNKITDVCSGNQYEILNETDFATFWSKKQDFWHYNFRYGFTLYQKTGSPDLRIPNKVDGTEIVPASIPNGYTRIANYKECQKTFNQCENVFKLDDVAEVSRDVLAVCPDTFYSGLYVRQNDGLYICAANNCEISAVSGTWRFRNRTTYAIPYLITQTNITNPGIENWSVVGVTCSNPVVFSNIDLYNADVDHILFTESTGIAKNIDLKTLLVDEGKDRGYLYYNYIDYRNFILYSTDKTLLSDVKVLKYIGIGNLISYDEETKLPNYDENNHCELQEV